MASLASVPGDVHEVILSLLTYQDLAAAHCASRVLHERARDCAQGSGYEEYGIPRRVFLPMRISRVAVGWNFSLAAAENGGVWSWGWNNKGKLGLGHRDDCALPQRIEIFDGIVISSLAARGAKAAAVCRGEVYAWGEAYADCGADALTPQRVARVGDDGAPFVAASLSLNFGVAVDAKGRCWWWGKTSCGLCPETLARIGGLGRVVQVACGSYHCVALGADGRVRTFGRNNCHQVAPATGGVWHWLTSAAVTLYAFLGLSARGEMSVWELGLGSVSQDSADALVHLRPHTISGLEGVAVVHAGYDNSFAVTREEELFAWGCGSSGGLAMGSCDDRIHGPSLVALGRATSVHGTHGYGAISRDETGREAMCKAAYTWGASCFYAQVRARGHGEGGEAHAGLLLSPHKFVLEDDPSP
ncbi:regulator of chromosome condensation 1/beta-lactamase-inhibitor protein II [Pelagophyceae sp. CCMP2097]|nr:regulator of chromosome condensation 1/beta-lactamase-inhibitor protein II [Pelagophyceae sp. CCMP2097]